MLTSHQTLLEHCYPTYDISTSWDALYWDFKHPI